MGRAHYRVTLADAREAHSRALELGGGRPGISRLESIEGALGRPYHGYHRRIARKAAALLHGFAMSHGFIDGNKRTAWLLTLLLVERSGFSLELRPADRIDEIAVAVVDGTMTEAELVDWFRERLQRAR